jgi:hypothetical protein
MSSAVVWAVVVPLGLIGTGILFLTMGRAQMSDDNEQAPPPALDEGEAPVAETTPPQLAEIIGAPVTTPTTTPVATTLVVDTTPATVPETSAEAPTTAATPVDSAAPPTDQPASPELAAQARDLAQRMVAAHAAGDWEEVRRLAATDLLDAEYEELYGSLDSATAIPVTTTATGASTVTMRLVIVEHRSIGEGPASVVRCAHWDMDIATQLVSELASIELTSGSGTITPAEAAVGAVASCAAVSLP